MCTNELQNEFSSYLFLVRVFRVFSVEISFITVNWLQRLKIWCCMNGSCTLNNEQCDGQCYNPAYESRVHQFPIDWTLPSIESTPQPFIFTLKLKCNIKDGLKLFRNRTKSKTKWKWEEKNIKHKKCWKMSKKSCDAIDKLF